VAGLGEQQTHGMLGGAHRVGAGGVHHRDAAPRGGMHVDVVDAGPGARDHSQIGSAREQVRRHSGLAPHDERVRAPERPLQLFARLAGAVATSIPGVSASSLSPASATLSATATR